MVATVALTAAIAAALLSAPAAAAGLYTKSSSVLQVDAKNYDRLIAKSNHTSIIEFYAPWCGHCQSLKPAYEKAAKNLAGLAKVAAVNCDEDSNKQFCGGMGVQGFPTLKIVRPGKKPGKPAVEDYNGPRSAKGIVDAVADKIPNHVKRLSDKTIDEWLKKSNDSAKAILFTQKGTTSALLKSLSVDFLDQISIAQVRDKEKSTVEQFGVTDFPKFVLLPGGDKAALLFDGELKREDLVAFLSQVASPNPDPPAKKGKEKPKTTKGDKEQKKAKKAKEAFDEASASQASEEASTGAADATPVELEDESNPTESPDPIASPDAPRPASVPNTPEPIPTAESHEQLKEKCLGVKTTTCILALLPKLSDPDASLPESATLAIASLSEIVHKHTLRDGKIFPFLSVPADVEAQVGLRNSLKLSTDDTVEIVAINGRRGWWKRFEATNFALGPVEDWIDAIRLGEGKKDKLPDGVLFVDEVHDEL